MTPEEKWKWWKKNDLEGSILQEFAFKSKIYSLK
jgi:hypothetical protein